MSPKAALRIATQEEWLTKSGFALLPPLFAPGTRVLPPGDHSFRVERQRVEDLPAFPAAAAALGRRREKVWDFLDAWGPARTVKVDVKETLRQRVDDKKLYAWSPKERDARSARCSTHGSTSPVTPSPTPSMRSRRRPREPGHRPREELERRAARPMLVPA